MLKKIKQKQPVAIDIADAALRPEVPTRLTPTFILFSILLLLLFIATRLHSLLALPAFYDEVGHITWAQQVFHGYALEPLIGAKPLMPYVLALFDPLTSTNGLFVGRVLVALTGLIGIAAMVGLGRLLHSKLAGIIGGLLWLLCPYLFFFERMVLADAILAALVTLTAWTLVRLSLRLNKLGSANGEAALAGIALALCALAKFTGLVFVVLPLLVLVLRINMREAPQIKFSWTSRLKAVFIVYIVYGAALSIPAIITITSRLATVEALNPVASNELSATDILLNIVLTTDSFVRYFSLPFLIFLLSTAFFAWRHDWRQRLIPLVMLFIPVGTLITTANVLYLRYLVIVVPGFLLLVTLGMARLVDFVATNKKRFIVWRAVVFLTLTFGLWLLLFVGPFMESTYVDPTTLPLPNRDKGEYLQNWPSGYGVREAAADLLQRARNKDQPLVVVGMIGDCLAIPLSLPANVPVTILCAPVNSTTVGGMLKTREIIRQQVVQNGSVLVIAEVDGPYSMWPLPTNSQLLATYPRPDGDYATVELFRVTSVWPTF
jgi:4-amino-4-deoxy-L-arabinose transferase-like glycosyltransferase